MKFSFREVNKKDEKLLFDWRNDSDTRRWSFNDKPILLSEHKKYFKKKIFDKKNHMWIFLVNKKSCGLVKINIEGNKAILSYLISKKFRGKKIASVMLIHAKNKICKQFPKINICAHTLSKNIISIKSLLRAGFVLKRSDSNKEIYVHKCI